MSISDGVQISGVRVPASIRALTPDRTTVALSITFLLAAAFYAWTVTTSYPLTLTNGHDAYNSLTQAFLHFHLSLGNAPEALTRLPNPYSPEQNAAFQPSYHDIVLYHGKFYITWGPAPVVAVLIPLHLLGLDPDSPVMAMFFAIVGLGFTLAILRLIVRQIGEVPVWMCVLAALTLALAAAMPFTLRRPAMYEEEIAAGYFFATAGVLLATSTLVKRRRTSLARLALISLLFGLATGSRATLVFTAILLVPLYLALRPLQPRRGLLISLTVPLGVCALLLLAYNQARFGSILENGSKYQLAGIDQRHATFDQLAYVPPGLWVYLLSPPRLTILFPFIFLSQPPVIYPFHLPGLYRAQTESVGLVPMAPVVLFLAALPWIWRRSALLGRLALPLLLLAGAGVACILFLSYLFWSATERYAVDFATLLLLGAVASWLVVSTAARGWRRRLARIGGAGLALWSCITGLAVSFTGYENLLAITHPGAWRTLQNISSPVSTGLAAVVGHPVLGEVILGRSPYVGVDEPLRFTVVSPGTRSARLLATLTPIEAANGVGYSQSYSATVAVEGPGRARSVYRIPPGQHTTVMRLPLSTGINRPALVLLGVKGKQLPEGQQLLRISGLSLAGER